MGIDGIGGPRPPGGPTGVGAGIDGGQSVGAGGSVVGGSAVEGAPQADAASDVSAATDVDRARLERGELSVEQYLELQVERATAHLVDHTPPAALELVQGELREQLAADPVLRALAERATTEAR